MSMKSPLRSMAGLPDRVRAPYPPRRAEEKAGRSAYVSASALLPRRWVNSSRFLLGQFLTLAGT